MTYKSLTMIGLAAALFIASTAVHAQGRPAGAGNNPGQRPSAGQQRDIDSMRQKADSRRLEAEAKRAEAEANKRSDQARTDHPPSEHAADAAFTAEENAGGSENSIEMRERRDEGKAIKEEYRDNREPGQEGTDPDDDKDVIAEKQKAKAKKPWWKFWGG